MRISWRNLFWKLLTFLISEIDAFSLIGTVAYGTFESGVCTGIRRMVSSQLPSVSVRGRSSVSAMSFKKDWGTFNCSCRKWKSAASGHSMLIQQLGCQLAFSTKPASQKRYFLICLLLSFILSLEEHLQSKRQDYSRHPFRKWLK